LLPTGQQQNRIYNPYNPVNKLIDQAAITEMLAKYGLQGPRQNAVLYQNACVHKSYVDRSDCPPAVNQAGQVVMAERPQDCLPLQKQHNERLEFVGDSILGAVIAIYLWTRYPDQNEGYLTAMRSKLANNKALGIIAKRMGLDQWVIMSRHVEDECGGRKNLRILGSALEAWIGAVYMDHSQSLHTDANSGQHSGFQAAQAFIINILETHVDFAKMNMVNTNYMDQLLKYYQREYHQPARYEDVEAIGPPHDCVFVVGVLSPEGRVISKARSRNKAVARQHASLMALLLLEGRIDSETAMRASEEIPTDGIVI
jgi:ribonuclease-3